MHHTNLTCMVLLLEVKENPRILSGPETLSVKEAECITLTYNISTGQPTAIATWTKVEETISANEKYTIDITTETASLTIKDVKPNDASTYTLKLENDSGTVTYSTTLTVISMCFAGGLENLYLVPYVL